MMYARPGHAELHTLREAYEGSATATVVKLLNELNPAWLMSQTGRAARDDMVLLHMATFDALTQGQQHNIVTKLGWEVRPNV